MRSTGDFASLCLWYQIKQDHNLNMNSHLLFVQMPNTTYVYIYFDKGLLWLHELQVIGMAYE